jgi:hypothetical protein
MNCTESLVAAKNMPVRMSHTSAVGKCARGVLHSGPQPSPGTMIRRIRVSGIGVTGP